MNNAIDVLQQHGVTEIDSASTQPTFSDGAAGKLCKSDIKELIVTDTVPLKPSALALPQLRVLSVAGLFAEAIRRIHEGESVGALFNPPGMQLPLQVT